LWFDFGILDILKHASLGHRTYGPSALADRLRQLLVISDIGRQNRSVVVAEKCEGPVQNPT
jgi:hypothetical protein